MSWRARNLSPPCKVLILSRDRARPMKSFIALALLFALGTTAQGKLAPVDAQPAAISRDDLAISSGPAGAMLERDYFRAPPATYAADHPFLCRLQLVIFDKRRLAQSCH